MHGIRRRPTLAVHGTGGVVHPVRGPGTVARAVGKAARDETDGEVLLEEMDIGEAMGRSAADVSTTPAADTAKSVDMQPWICANTECNLIHDNPNKPKCRACGTKRPKGDVGAAAVAVPATLISGPAVKLLNRWAPHTKSEGDGGAICMDAADDDGDAYHGRLAWYQASIAEARTRGEESTAKFFEAQLKELKPPDVAQAAKDTRLLSQKLIDLKTKTEKQVKTLEATAMQANDAVKARAAAKDAHLQKLKDEYESKVKRDAASYDQSIRDSEAEGKKATEEVSVVRKRYDEEYARIQAAIVKMNNTKDIPTTGDDDDDGDAISSLDDDFENMSVASSTLKAEVVPAAVTVDQVNLALQMPDGQAISPDLLQRILDAHAAAAKAHAEAQMKADADAGDAASPEALKRQREELENAREAAEMNGDAYRAAKMPRATSTHAAPATVVDDDISKAERDKLKAKQKKERQKLAKAQKQTLASTVSKPCTAKKK